MTFDLDERRLALLEGACRSGLIHEPQFSHGDCRRRVWLDATSFSTFVGTGPSAHWAADDVRAFLDRFVEQDLKIMVGQKTGLSAVPDFKLTQGGGGSVFEIRFDIEDQPLQLRLFGRFVATDAFVISSFGEKGTTPQGKQVSINVGHHRVRCQSVFERIQFPLQWVPPEDASLTNCRKIGL